MAALSLIFGSLLGWVIAGLALATGAVASTAVILFVVTSLISAAGLLYTASLQKVA